MSYLILLSLLFVSAQCAFHLSTPIQGNRKLDNGNQLPCAIAGSKSDDPLIVVPGVTSVLIVPVVDSMEGELAGSISAKINGFGDTVATSSVNAVPIVTINPPTLSVPIPDDFSGEGYIQVSFSVSDPDDVQCIDIKSSPAFKLLIPTLSIVILFLTVVLV